MSKLLTVTINLTKTLNLEIEGYYDKGQFATYTYPIEDSIDNIASSFEINDIKITKGTLLDFIYATDGRQFVIDYLEELTIKKIEER